MRTVQNLGIPLGVKHFKPLRIVSTEKIEVVLDNTGGKVITLKLGIKEEIKIELPNEEEVKKTIKEEYFYSQILLKI